MSDIEMFHVGENESGEKLYNLRYVKGGVSLPTPSMTEAQALAKINGTEVTEEVATTTDAPDYKSMKKIELEALMRTHGIELDRRKSKKDLMMEVDTFFKGS
tara:strand:- start:158 stop:463 length:306 start_codon:yes stop_codon:yes gene_type:complete